MAERSEEDETKGSCSPAWTPALDHEALLTLARKVYAAASDGDLDHVKTAAGEFASALFGHLQEEASTMHRLTPAEERILHRGQDRLWSAATELLRNADESCPHPAEYCSGRAEELLALMMLQAHDERRAHRRSLTSDVTFKQAAVPSTTVATLNRSRLVC